MEFWNSRKMLAPPTYTYEAKVDDIDINHLKTILQDGMKFYNEQLLFNIETTLLGRIVYRLKTKFRNSKDFQTLEKVKKMLTIFKEMNISRKLEYLLSILPNYDYQQVVVSLPTKNMIDYILVQLQGVGKILCKAIETCKLTVLIYEHRLYLGHFWKLAMIAISLVSRIHILCLNHVKFTCHLYLRLLPFSHKLKNVTTNWLPKDYVFPKNLQSWLDVEWSKLEEVIEIPDKEFNLSFIDLAEDSDDEVEYIEIMDDSKIIEDYKKILRTHVKKQDFDEPLIFYESNNIDLGEEILSDEEQIVETHGEMLSGVEISEPGKDQQNDPGDNIVDELAIKEGVSSSSQEKVDEHDIGEIIVSEEEIVETPPIPSTSVIKKKNRQKSKQIKNKKEHHVIISSSEDEDSSVLFVAETTSTKKTFSTTDFIPLGESTPFQNRKKLRGSRRSKSGNKNTNNDSFEGDACSTQKNFISPKTSASKKKIKKSKMKLSPKNLKRQLSTDGNNSNIIPNKRKKK